jgi:hypothetical protein
MRGDMLATIRLLIITTPAIHDIGQPDGFYHIIVEGNEKPKPEQSA